MPIESVVETRPAILFYDGQCSLCQACIAWLEASGRQDIVAVDAADRARAHRLGVADLDQLNRRICLLLPDGRTLWGFDAVIEMLDREAICIAPILRRRRMRAIGTYVYDWVAAHRRCGTCQRGTVAIEESQLETVG